MNTNTTNSHTHTTTHNNNNDDDDLTQPTHTITTTTTSPQRNGSGNAPQRGPKCIGLWHTNQHSGPRIHQRMVSDAGPRPGCPRCKLWTRVRAQMFVASTWETLGLEIKSCNEPASRSSSYGATASSSTLLASTIRRRPWNAHEYLS